MRKINRLFLLCIGVVLGSFLFPGNFTVQGCSACNNPPEELKTYMDMMDELITFVMENPRIENEEEQEETREITLIEFDKDITNQRLVAENLLQTVIKAPINLNPFNSRSILRRGNVTVRDKLLLEDIDTKLIQALLIAQREGYLPVTLQSGQYEQIDTILKKSGFMQLQERGGSYNMHSAGANYADFIGLLWQLNQIVKTFHDNQWYQKELKELTGNLTQAHVEDPQQAKDLPSIISQAAVYREINIVIVQNLISLTNGRSGPGVDWIEFLEEKNILLAYVWAISEAYLCATGVQNQCNTERSESIESAHSNFESDFKRSGGNAINTFKESFSRLMGALYIGSPAAKKATQQRQDALMQSMYGFTHGDVNRWRDGVGNAARSSSTTIGSIGKMFARVATNTVNVEYNTTSSPWLSRAISSARNIQDDNRDTETWSETSTQDKINQILEYRSPRFQEITAVPEVAFQSDSFDLRGITQASQMERESRSLFSTYQNMIRMQDEMSKTFVFVSPYEYTKQFPALSKAVYTNIDMIQQEEKNQEGLYGIYNAMGLICEEQCENLSRNCRYNA